MNEAQITDALMIEAGLVATTLALAMAFPDRSLDSGNAAQYLEAVQFRNTTDNPTWGGEAVYMGILQITVVQRMDDQGIMPGTNLQLQIADMFKKNRVIRTLNGKIKIYQNPSVLTPITEQGKTLYPVSIPYLASRSEAG